METASEEHYDIRVLIFRYRSQNYPCDNTPLLSPVGFTAS